MECIRCSKRTTGKGREGTEDGLCARCRHCLKNSPQAQFRPWQSNIGLGLEERFWVKVDQSGGAQACWPWTARLDGDGYGQFRIDGASKRAHRVAYEFAIGPVAAGAVLDHTCHTQDCDSELLTMPMRLCEPFDCPHRACCNPAHLKPVTQQENILRGKGLPALNAVKTHCKEGHEFTPENTVETFYPNGRYKGRNCRVCKNQSTLESWHRNKHKYK